MLTVALAAVIAAVVAALVAVAVARWGRRDGLEGRRVVVNTRRPDDQSLAGVLVARRRDGLSLEHVSQLTPDGVVEIPGAVFVPADSVAWLQIP